ncbi:MAG TPA: hypothetical protein VK778_11015 [Solirubrobacteraceae bacterium]|jgi:hypothetical protein|nr:hypothetical protein [Solirubrobacteraceae bacterium]
MLRDLTSSARRLALVGLAKNTGKTVALTALLRELEGDGGRTGVTSVGRDGEGRDVIDSRIEKPRIGLSVGSLVATTDTLLRASAIPHELLEDPGMRTPLGRVLIARLQGAGEIEIAGPSAAQDVRAVSDAMLAHGAEQVLIDGAVDRRAASAPDVADGLVMSTGAVLDRDIDEVVLKTRDAVDLVRLPLLEDSSDAGRRLRELAAACAGGAAGVGRASVLVGEDLEPVVLPPRFVLTAEAEQVAQLLDENPGARWLLVAGALADRFLRSLLHPLHHRGRELFVVVADPTKAFLWKRGPEWYRLQGVLLQTLAHIELRAITVNPVAPQSHRFDSAQLCALLREAIPDVPIFDVLDAEHAGPRKVGDVAIGSA